MISASQLHRVLACPASELLPHIRSTSGRATRGTSIHAYIRRRIAGLSHDDAAVGVDKDHRLTCKGIDVEEIVAGLSQVACEVSYAFSLKGEVRRIGVNLGREYPEEYLTGEWITGTADLDAVGEEGRPVVEDFKTGQGVPHPSVNPQILFFASCLQSLTGAAEVEGRIRYIRDDGSTYVESHIFDAFDLDAFRLDLRRTGLSVLEARQSGARSLPMATGGHCKYCPAIAACPAKTALARAMLPELRATGDILRSMTPEERGQAWVRAKEIESILDTVVSGLRDIAIVDPTPLPDGKVLMAIESSRTSFDKEAAMTLLRELGATDEQIEACSKRSRFDVVKAVKTSRNGKSAA